jgi:hypothetical protein
VKPPVPKHRGAAGTAAVGFRRAGNTRRPALCGRPRYCETATCVHGRGHCASPDGSRGSSSAPGCGSSWPVVHSTPADRTTESKKNFGCVTTRRRNLLAVRRLGHGFGSLTAHALSLGVFGLHLGVLTASGLSPRRLPATDFALAFGILAVALVPASRLVPASAPFAQAEPRAWSSDSGTTAVLGFTVVGAHGSVISQGTARGERANVLLGRLFKTGIGDCWFSLKNNEGTRQRRKTILEATGEGDKARRQPTEAIQTGSVSPIETGSLFPIGPNYSFTRSQAPPDLRFFADAEGIRLPISM